MGYYSGHHHYYAGLVDHNSSHFGLIEEKNPFGFFEKEQKVWQRAKRELNSRERRIAQGLEVVSLSDFLAAKPYILIHFPDAATNPVYQTAGDTSIGIESKYVKKSKLPLILGITSLVVVGLIVRKKMKGK